MEGLIKGLINVAIDAVEGNDNDDDESHRRTQSSSEQEERSRSTWAEVVSGKEEKCEEKQGSGSAYHRPSSWGRNEQSEERWENISGKQQQYQDGDWETVGNKKKHPGQTHGKPQKTEVWYGYKQNPSEQEYSDFNHQNLNLEPTNEELHDLSKACSRLWDLDLNRLIPERDYRINLGEGKRVYQKGDVAEDTLFSWLSDDVLKKPTFSRFCALLDNYNPNEGYKEEVTQQDRHEQVAFIEEISRTAPVKYVFKYLVERGVLNCDYEGFKKILNNLWFDLYGRGGGSGSSSAFEHVFVGEIKGRGEHEVSGFHNWIQFYLEEAKGTVDYQGYIFPRRRGELPDSETQVLTIQFEWHGVLKSVSSTMIGVSPEFEIALYTLCFFVGHENNEINLGPYCVNIKCYRFGNNDKIGSVFPIVQN